MKSPLGPYGSAVAAIVTILVAIAGIGSHVLPGIAPSDFLDTLTSAVIFGALGVQVATNGSTATSAAALAAATAAHNRLDEIKAPPAGTVNVP